MDHYGIQYIVLRCCSHMATIMSLDKKKNVLHQVTDQLYHTMLYPIHLSMWGIPTYIFFLLHVKVQMCREKQMTEKLKIAQWPIFRRILNRRI